MLQQEICPDCNDLIPADRMDEEMTVCTCGYTRSKAEAQSEAARNKRTSYVIIFLSLVMISSFIHTAKWGQDSVKVTPLEVSRVFGTISPDQALALGDMSIDKNFLNQAEEMYKIYLKAHPNDLAVNEKMGMLLFRQDKFEEAVPYFENYFTNNGEEPNTLFSYGKALTESQDLSAAEEVFLKLIEAKPDTYQITVVQALVDLYITQNKLKEAKKFISELIKPGYEVPDHLREQKDHINELLKKKS